MSIAKILEITAESPTGFEDAVQQGIARASKTVEHIQSAWIKDQEVIVRDGKPSRYRVAMKLTFMVEG